MWKKKHLDGEESGVVDDKTTLWGKQALCREDSFAGGNSFVGFPVVRSAAGEEKLSKNVPYSDLLAPSVSLLRFFASPQTEIFDAVERVQVEDGWVSMRLREDTGSGVPLLMPLN